MLRCTAVLLKLFFIGAACIEIARKVDPIGSTYKNFELTESSFDPSLKVFTGQT